MTRAFDLDSVTEWSRAGVRADRGPSSLSDSGRTDGDVMPSGTMPAQFADVPVLLGQATLGIMGYSDRLAVYACHSATTGRKLGARLSTRRWAETGRSVARSGS